MPTEELGVLQRVDPSNLWNHEAYDFTPWLLENAEGLADVLGIDLELEEAEHRVGTFSLDIIGRDATNDTILIIENQLAGTDHGHLGQILTYAAGADASTIVWIATAFRDEHRQALDWLNEKTGPDTHFFGIEIEAFRIGDSHPAPYFKVLAQPNDWQKVVRGATQGQKSSGRAALYAEFWDKLLAELADKEPGWTSRRAGRTTIPTNWIAMSSPVAGASLNFSFARGKRLRSELYIDSGDQAENRRVFDALSAQRQILESSFGRPLEFEAMENKRAARIAEYTEGDVAEQAQHGAFIAWFIDSGRRFRKSLAAIDLSRVE